LSAWHRPRSPLCNIRDGVALLDEAMVGRGMNRCALLTDVSGEPFWTIVAEARVEKVDDFFVMQRALMANEALKTTMADYHDLVETGRREVSRVET
jgi:hypothetical protein